MSLERAEQLGTPVGLGRGAFLGKHISTRSVAGTTLTDYAYAPAVGCPMHYHEHAYLSFLLSGSYIERAGRAERACVPMTGLYHPAGELHRDTFGGRGGRLFSIELPASWIARLDGYQITTHSASWLDRPDASALMVRMHAETGSQDPLSALLLEGLLMEVLATLPRRRGAAVTHRRPSWLPGVQSYLEAHFRHPPGLSAIAAAAGVHPVEVARGFRTHLKCSVGEYARRLRVQAACRDLAATDVPLAEVALRAGFADQSHLTRSVRRATGYTPAQLRRHLRRTMR